MLLSTPQMVDGAFVLLHPILQFVPLATSPPALTRSVHEPITMTNPAGEEADADAPTWPGPASEAVVSTGRRPRSRDR